MSNARAASTVDPLSSYFDLQFESSSSSCSSSPPTSSLKVHHQHENDSGCGSDDDPALALKISKGLAMGYDYDFIKSVIEQQNDGDDMSKFIETMVRTAETQAHSLTSPLPSGASPTPATDNQKANIDIDSLNISITHDVYIIDGADLAYTLNLNNSFSWRPIELCLKYLQSHGHKKVFVVLPYALKHHRHDQQFLESKSLRDLERKNLLVYTNRLLKQTNKSAPYTHINEMLKFSQKTKGFLITNVTLKDILLDFTVYKQILEERVIRYRFQHENFQPLLVNIINGDDGSDCETYYPLCPYGKKCTYGSKCKYFHIERRHHQNSVSDHLHLSKYPYSNPSIPQGFSHTKSSPEHLYMYNSPVSHDQYSTIERSLVDDARTAYEYGLSSTPMSNEFSFVDPQLPLPSNRPIHPHHQSWFGTPNTPAQPFCNRTLSMPQPTTTNEIVQMQQQNWLRQQQMFPIEQQPQHFDLNVLRFLSMMSLQQQNNQVNCHQSSYLPLDQQSQYDGSSVNSQQGLADKIQGVRHLWEPEMSTSNEPNIPSNQSTITTAAHVLHYH